MKDPIARLREEHANFARLLHTLEAQLDLLHGDSEPNYELMLDVMYYMTHFPDIFHHPREELAFALLGRRLGAARAVVAELSHEHDTLRSSGASLVQELEGVNNGAIVTRESIELPGRAYVAAFRRHIDREEGEVFPMVRKALNGEDWVAIDASVFPSEDPLFGRVTENRYERLRDHIARDARV
jgi:hemerythrin-like domain-containing protein